MGGRGREMRSSPTALRARGGRTIGMCSLDARNRGSISLPLKMGLRIRLTRAVEDHSGPPTKVFSIFPTSLKRGVAKAALYCARLFHPPTHWYAGTCP